MLYLLPSSKNKQIDWKEFKIGDKVMVKELGLKQMYEVKDTTRRKFRRHRDHLKATNISHNKCVSEDVYSSTSLASERCINTAKLFVAPKRNHKPVERKGFVL